jgi:hypothetical protein
MTDRSARLSPDQVEVTVQFLNETNAKQRAYAERRRVWTTGFHPAEARTQALAVTRRRGQIHDPRQTKLDL